MIPKQNVNYLVIGVVLGLQENQTNMDEIAKTIGDCLPYVQTGKFQESMATIAGFNKKKYHTCANYRKK